MKLIMMVDERDLGGPPMTRAMIRAKKIGNHSKLFRRLFWYLTGKWCWGVEQFAKDFEHKCKECEKLKKELDLYAKCLNQIDKLHKGWEEKND